MWGRGGEKGTIIISCICSCNTSHDKQFIIKRRTFMTVYTKVHIGVKIKERMFFHFIRVKLGEEKYT